MKCGKCGRKIRNPDSVKSGYGPVCYQKMFGVPAKRKKKPPELSEDEQIPGQMTLEECLEAMKRE